MICVESCPMNVPIPLFKDDNLGACVDDCEGLDWWADEDNNKCTSTCPTAQFEDNSTSRNRCTD